MKQIKLSTSKKVKKKRTETGPYANIDWNKAAILFQKPIPKSKGKYPSVKNILQALAVVGGVGLVFAFPGAAVGIGLILGENSYSRWGSKKIINQLEKQKYVEVKHGEGGSVSIIITKKGLTRALTYQLDEMKLIVPKKWDKKWRVVIFDISEKHKWVRDVFRMRLRQLGLYQLQKSVFVSPYPCFDEIEFLRELYGERLSVQYLLVEKLEDDDWLRDRFELT